MDATALPRAFSDRPVLATAAALAVGLATSAATTAACGVMGLTVEATLPTLVLTWIWAAVMLRAPFRASTGKRSLAPWVLAIPLAVANGAATAALLFLLEKDTFDASGLASSLLGGLFFGSTFGALFWVPGLAAVLATFGLPLGFARRLRERGVPGRDAGSAVAVLAAAAVAAIALLFLDDGPGWRARQVPRLLVGLARPGIVHTAIVVPALATLLVAIVVTGAVLVRMAGRRVFLADVARGAVPGLRLDAEDGVLVRVGTDGSYRLASREDEVLVVIDPRPAGATRA